MIQFLEGVLAVAIGVVILICFLEAVHRIRVRRLRKQMERLHRNNQWPEV